MPRARSKSSSVTGGNKGRKAARSLKKNTMTARSYTAVVTPPMKRRKLK